MKEVLVSFGLGGPETKKIEKTLEEISKLTEENPEADNGHITSAVRAFLTPNALRIVEGFFFFHSHRSRVTEFLAI